VPVKFPDPMTTAGRLHLRGDDRFGRTSGRSRHPPTSRDTPLVTAAGVDAGEKSTVCRPSPEDDGAATRVIITRRHGEGTPARALDEAVTTVKTLSGRPCASTRSEVPWTRPDAGPLGPFVFHNCLLIGSQAMNANFPTISVTFSDNGPPSLVSALDLFAPMFFAIQADNVGVSPRVAALIKLAADHIVVLQTELHRLSLTDPALAAQFVEANVDCEAAKRNIVALHETYLAEQAEEAEEAEEALAETHALRRQAAIDAVICCPN
jgi:hypothetical protein